MVHKKHSPKEKPYEQFSYPKFDRIVKKLPKTAQEKIIEVESEVAKAPLKPTTPSGFLLH